MNPEDDDIIIFWKALHKYEVEYILVGGFAVNFHGFARNTGDLDVWIKDSTANRQKLIKAFSEVFNDNFNYMKTMQFIPGWSCFKMEKGFEIDIMTDLKGLPQSAFDACLEKSRTESILGIPVRFLNYNDLVKSKLAAGRPKDIMDIEELKLRNTDDKN